MMNTPRQTQREGRASTAALVSWAFYDWGHSAFPTVVETFLFAAYFTRQIASAAIQGSAQWGMTIGFAGLIVALSAPPLGADRRPGRSAQTVDRFLHSPLRSGDCVSVVRQAVCDPSR